MNKTLMARVDKVVDAARDDASECPLCGHAMEHSRREYEDTHERCAHETEKKEGCYAPHKRFNRACYETTIVGRCWISKRECDCSSEDRAIAVLLATKEQR